MYRHCNARFGVHLDRHFDFSNRLATNNNQIVLVHPISKQYFVILLANKFKQTQQITEDKNLNLVNFRNKT